MAFQPRPYQLVGLPQGPDPLRSLSDLASTMGQFQAMRQQKDEDLYRQQERTRVTEDRQIMQSAMSSQFKPDEVKAQLTQLGRGDLVPIFEQSHNDLQVSRNTLKKTKMDLEAAEADYWGGHAATVLAVKPEDRPVALKYVLGEAANDGYDVERIQQQLQEQPDALPTILESLIQRSPTQMKRRDEAADRTLAQTRENRFLAESTEREADRQARERDRVADNARLEREATERAADRQSDNARLLAGHATLSAKERADIETQRATNINEIIQATKTTRLDRYGDPIPPMPEAEAQAMIARINRAADAALGVQPKQPKPQAPSRRSPGTGPAWVPPASTRAGDGVRVGSDVTYQGRRYRVVGIGADGQADLEPLP